MKLTPFKCVIKLSDAYFFVVQAISAEDLDDVIFQAFLACADTGFSSGYGYVHQMDVKDTLEHSPDVPEDLRDSLVNFWDRWYKRYDDHFIPDFAYFTMKQDLYRLLSIADWAKLETFYKTYSINSVYAQKILRTDGLADVLKNKRID